MLQISSDIVTSALEQPIQKRLLLNRKGCRVVIVFFGTYEHLEKTLDFFEFICSPTVQPIVYLGGSHYPSNFTQLQCHSPHLLGKCHLLSMTVSTEAGK